MKQAPEYDVWWDPRFNPWWKILIGNLKPPNNRRGGLYGLFRPHYPAFIDPLLPRKNPPIASESSVPSVYDWNEGVPEWVMNKRIAAK